MATENALMAAALIPGTSILGNAACEPHVQDLARMLVKMGADIQGIGSNLLTVHGAASLHGCEHEVAPDHIEIGSFMALAGVTGGELRIKDTVPGDLRMIRLAFERLGLRPNSPATTSSCPASRSSSCSPTTASTPERCRTAPGRPSRPTSPRSPSPSPPRPRIRSSCTSGCSRTASCSSTSSTRWARTSSACDPHRVVVNGPRRLRGAPTESPDIRAGMAMLLAALCAEGRSEIGNIRQIDRGYERIDERLRELGAHIERVATEPVAA